MSSLTTKANKSRSAASPKLPAKSSKKTVKKEAKQPAPTKTSSKSAKAVSLKAEKRIAINKKTSAPKVSAKPVAAKIVKKAAVKTVAPKNKPVAAKSKAIAPKAKTVIAQGKAIAKGKKEALTTATRRPERKASKPIENHIKKASTPNTLAAVSSFEQGLKLFNKHDFAGARDLFERILQKFSEQAEINVSVRRYLAICQQKLARTPSAPKNPDALYDQGVFELNRANIREAMQLFEKALKAQPDAAHVLYSLAAAYARLENPRKALETLRKAIHLQSVHRSRARSDQDFASLHTDDEFQNLTGYGLGFFED
jgi:tetratricopeptide (TPR) repeat protein